MLTKIEGSRAFMSFLSRFHPEAIKAIELDKKGQKTSGNFRPKQ